MKMKQYYTVERDKRDDEDCDMLSGPTSSENAWAFMRKLRDEFPFRFFDVVTRVVDVEDYSVL